ncbi:MAG: hypothetical protein HQL16_08390, partial [Candidatus Omnitrophica bacterium]|nr:hypothetical protein [Candidatus Omnitrophota bacterium]
ANFWLGIPREEKKERAPVITELDRIDLPDWKTIKETITSRATWKHVAVLSGIVAALAVGLLAVFFPILIILSAANEAWGLEGLLETAFTMMGVLILVSMAPHFWFRTWDKFRASFPSIKKKAGTIAKAVLKKLPRIFLGVALAAALYHIFFASNPLAGAALAGVFPFIVPEKLIQSLWSLPQAVRRDKKGRIYAFWAMVFGAADWVLSRERGARRLGQKFSFILDRVTIDEIRNYLEESYGLMNVEREDTGIRVKEIMTYLEEMNLLRREGSHFVMAQRPEAMATWARRNGYMEEELTDFFTPQGAIK